MMTNELTLKKKNYKYETQEFMPCAKVKDVYRSRNWDYRFMSKGIFFRSVFSKLYVCRHM